MTPCCIRFHFNSASAASQGFVVQPLHFSLMHCDSLSSSHDAEDFLKQLSLAGQHRWFQAYFCAIDVSIWPKPCFQNDVCSARIWICVITAKINHCTFNVELLNWIRESLCIISYVARCPAGWLPGASGILWPLARMAQWPGTRGWQVSSMS